MSRIFKPFFLLLAVLAGHCLHAQVGQDRIVKKYAVNDGLSQGVINCITQDDKGLMWFATEDGLNRFDGYSFKTFKYHADDTKGTADNFIQHIYKDSQGIIWVSSRMGLYRFDQTREQFTLYNIPGNTRDVSYITEGYSKNLWIALYGGGFLSFNRETKEMQHYGYAGLPGLSSVATITMLEDSYGLLWVGSQNQGLNVFKVRDGNVHERRDDLSVKSILPSVYIKSMVEDHQGNVWIGTTKGLVVYLRRDNRFHVFNRREDLKGRGIFTLYFDSDKNLWIGTQSEGAIKTDLRYFDARETSSLVFNQIDVLDRFSIAQHTIRSIYEDRDGNLWLGTHGDGVYFVSHVAKKFRKFQTKLVIKAAENFVQYYGLCYDEQGYLWLGTDGKGLYKATVNGEIVKNYTADGRKGSLTDNVVLSAYKDHEGRLWFGTFNHGLFLYDKERETFTNFNHAQSDSAGPLGNQVRLIFEDSHNNLWVGASRGGLCRVSREEGVFRHHSPGKAINGMDVRAVVEDKAGNLWVGGYGDGLHYVDSETGASQRYFYESEENNPLKSNVVFALAMDRRGRLWIGTGGGGLGMYDPAIATLKHYTETDGLINNTIYGLLIDDGDRIWVSTNKGISRLDPETEQFYSYTAYDGLQEGQFNPGSALYNPVEEYMCFGGALGLNLFYPEKINNDFGKLVVMISGFQLFNKPVEISNGPGSDHILDKSISETDEIVLRHEQSVFTFEFMALNYSFPERTRYAYKLEGLETAWNYVGDQRMATYRYLSPGSYTFKVRATNRENVWPDEYARVRLVVLPPFWKTPYAYVLYLLVLGAMVYGVIMVRKKELALRRRLRTEKAQRKRERQLVKEKLSFFTEVSHEFRTPLTLMIGPLEEMVTREGAYTPAGKRLRMVYRNAHKLLNLINMLLDYRKVESGKMVLKAKEDNIVAFVEEIFITFKELALRRHIKFQLHAPEPAIQAWFDKEKLEMVLNNILSNSFKYIGKGNAISVSVEETGADAQPGKVSIEIRDNGMGIPKEHLRHIFDWFYQGNNATPVSSGIGLALAKKLVHLHKGHILVESTEQGTMFRVEIPLGREHLAAHDVIIDERAGQLILEEHALAEETSENDPDADHSHKKGLKSILLVEDDDEIRAFLKEYLERDYRILEAVNGLEALEVSSTHPTDLVVSDIMMPEMNGIDLCKALKSNIKTSHIPVVLLTAKTSMTHHKEGLEIGADAYITKPFSPEMLALTINNLLQAQENLKRFYRNIFASGNGAAKKDPVSLDERFLQQVFDTLQANLDRPEFNLDELCEALGMSRSLLYKKIKSLTGQSPVEYLRSLRLQEAARLLKTRQYKVFEVVYMVGFTDLKYFRQCFVKEFGYPPSEIISR